MHRNNGNNCAHRSVRCAYLRYAFWKRRTMHATTILWRRAIHMKFSCALFPCDRTEQCVCVLSFAYAEGYGVYDVRLSVFWVLNMYVSKYGDADMVLCGEHSNCLISWINRNYLIFIHYPVHHLFFQPWKIHLTAGHFHVAFCVWIHHKTIE